jgi:hypothetical protein
MCCRITAPGAVVVQRVLFLPGIYLEVGTELSSLIVTFFITACLDGLKRMARDLSTAVVWTGIYKCCRLSHVAR